MLSSLILQIGIWVAIVIMGVCLGESFEFIPCKGRKGDWVITLVVAPAMLVCAGLLAFSFASL